MMDVRTVRYQYLFSFCTVSLNSNCLSEHGCQLLLVFSSLLYRTIVYLHLFDVSDTISLSSPYCISCHTFRIKDPLLFHPLDRHLVNASRPHYHNVFAMWVAEDAEGWFPPQTKCV